MERIQRLGTTMLVVTHEKGLVNHFNKRVIHIGDGVVVSDEEDGFYIYRTQTKVKKRRKSRNFGYYGPREASAVVSHGFMSIAAVTIIAAPAC